MKGSKVYTFFSIGKENSGLSLHSHSEAFNGLIHGTKRWFIIPKSSSVDGDDQDTDSNQGGDLEEREVDVEGKGGQDMATRRIKDIYWDDVTATARDLFLHGVLPNMRKKPLECYQHAGDMMYVPMYFPHTVFNIGETVAISAVHLAFIDNGFGQ